MIEPSPSDSPKKKTLLLKHYPNISEYTKRRFIWLIGFNFFLTVLTIELSKYYFSIYSIIDYYKIKTIQNSTLIEFAYCYVNLIIPLFVGFIIDYMGARRSLAIMCLLIIFGNFFYVVSTITNCSLSKVSYVLEYGILGTYILSIGGESIYFGFFALILNYYKPEFSTFGINPCVAFGLFGRAFISFAMAFTFFFFFNKIEVKLTLFSIVMFVISFGSFGVSLVIVKKDVSYKKVIHYESVRDVRELMVNRSRTVSSEKMRNSEKLEFNSKKYIHKKNETLVFSNRSNLEKMQISRRNNDEKLEDFEKEINYDETIDVYPFTFWESFKLVLNFRQILVSLYIAIMIATFSQFLSKYYFIMQFDEIFFKVDWKVVDKDLTKISGVFMINFFIMFFVYSIAGIIVFFLKKYIAETGNRAYFLMGSTILFGFVYFCFSQLFYSFNANPSYRIMLLSIGFLVLCFALGFLYSSVFSCVILLANKINVGMSFGFISCITCLIQLIQRKTSVEFTRNPDFLAFSNYFKNCALQCIVALVILACLLFYDQENGNVLSRKIHQSNAEDDYE